MQEKVSDFSDVMPQTKWLKQQWWHRFVLVVWYLSFTPLLLNLSLVIFDSSFSFNFWDFTGLLLFGYLAVPMVYRVFLFIVLGDYKKIE